MNISQSSLQDARKKHKSLAISWLDLVHHSLIDFSLRHYHAPLPPSLSLYGATTVHKSPSQHPGCPNFSHLRHRWPKSQVTNVPAIPGCLGYPRMSQLFPPTCKTLVAKVPGHNMSPQSRDDAIHDVLRNVYRSMWGYIHERCLLMPLIKEKKNRLNAAF